MERADPFDRGWRREIQPAMVAGWQAVHYILGKCINSVDIQTLRIENLACFESADFLEAFEISPDGQRLPSALTGSCLSCPTIRKN